MIYISIFLNDKDSEDMKIYHKKNLDCSRLVLFFLINLIKKDNEDLYDLQSNKKSCGMQNRLIDFVLLRVYWSILKNLQM